MARKVTAHPERCFNALIIPGKLILRLITHAFVKALRRFVDRAHFEDDAKDSGHDGAFFEPLEKLASNAFSSKTGSHREEIQVRVIVAITHDPKTDDTLVNSRD